MKLGKRFMLMMVASVFVTTLPTAAFFYQISQKQQLENEILELKVETEALMKNHETQFKSAQLSLEVLAHQLQQLLTLPPQKSERLEFDNLIKQNADKAWRTTFDATKPNETGIFLPPDAALGQEQKQLHLRIKKAFDQFQTVLGEQFGNIWFITPEKTEVIFDKAVPNFVNVMDATTDYTQTPWMTLGNVEKNPKRELRWTTPLFDPVIEGWVVSAVYPLDINGRWIGMIGHDIYLKNVMSKLFEPPLRFKNGLRFLLDGENNVILAGAWQKEFEKQPDSFQSHLALSPELSELLKQPLTNESLSFNQPIHIQGKAYIAVALKIQFVDWRYFRLIPIDEILAPTRYLFLILAAGMVLLGFGIGFLIRFGLNKNVVLPLEKLTTIIENYGQNDFSIRANFSGNDEISILANDFDSMANRIEQQRKTEVYLLRRDRLAIDMARDGICVLDEKGNLNECNPAFCKLLGYSHDEILKLNVTDWDVKFSDAELAARIQDILENGDGGIFETVHRRKDRSIYFAEISAIRIEKDNKNYIWCSTRDVSERKKSSYKLKENEKKLRLANADLLQFTNIAAHHLQEPTRRIISFVQRLKNTLISSQKTDDEIDFTLNFIEQSASRQRALVRDIQLYLAAPQPRATFEWLDVTEVLKKVVESHATLIQQTQTQLEYENLPSVVIDRPRLYDIFSILLDNAIAYSQPDCIPKIRIYGEFKADRVWYYVEDNGIGIPDEYRERVFLVFERLQVSGNSDSTGIGLAIVRRIVESCNGSVSLKETVGGGTTVTFDLPARF